MTSPASGPPPGATGTYVLFLRPRGPGEIRIGRLGALELAPGRYGYVGSAFGPGGLDARLGRHVRGGDSLHWHVDYLRRRCVPVEAWVTTDGRRWEHRWARALAAVPGSSEALAGFGASDCGCSTHLYHFPAMPDVEAFRARAAGAAADGREPARVRRREL